MNLCKNCVHFQYGRGMGALCGRRPISIDPLYGTRKFATARSERECQQSDYCGPGGIFWEELIPEVKKPTPVEKMTILNFIKGVFK